MNGKINKKGNLSINGNKDAISNLPCSIRVLVKYMDVLVVSNLDDSNKVIIIVLFVYFSAHLASKDIFVF